MFNFFKVVPINKFVKQTNNVISYANNTSYTVLCNRYEVQIYYKDWEFIALEVEDIQFCCIPDDSNYLVLLSQNPVENKIILKVYNIFNKLNRKTAILLNNSIIESNYKVTCLSALKLSDTQLYLSIGLDNGNVYFCRNTLCKDSINETFVMLNVCLKQIKGIKFSKIKQKDANMFICSDTGVFCYTITNNMNLNETKLILDDMTSFVHCSTLKPSIDFEEEQYFVVARDDGLYCYTSEGRGPCYAINGYKMAVEWLGKRLIILLKSKDGSHLKENCFHLVIIDIVNKIIVLNKEFNEELFILPITGQHTCLILLKSGAIFALVEHELRYKLSHLLKKNLFDVAVKFLEESSANSDTISNVYINYGDHLLQRGDTSNAIKLYSKTIGIIPPFLIIKKLMSFRYNEYLIQYLSHLVNTKYNLPEYVELLNNCYQRIELPRNAFRIFGKEEKDYNQLYFDNKINRFEEVRMVIQSLQENKNIPTVYFNDLETAEVLNFFSEFGYDLIKKYPNELKNLVNYLLSKRFIHDSFFQSIIISLSLMNKAYAIDFIHNIISYYDHESIYNIWTELILQTWNKGNMELNYVIEFFKIYQSKMNVDNVFILCRNYKFWPGIRIMMQKSSMEMLSTHCLVKSFEMFPEYTNSSLLECGCEKKSRLWIQTLKTNKLATNYSFKLLTDIINNIINDDPYCILNIIDGFDNKTKFLLSHLNEFLFNECFFTYFKNDEDCQIVSLLEDRVVHIENTLNNYLNRPIEFRNRSCDICKQIIKQPSVYFLCQHAYHSECIRQYNEILMCIVCGNIKKIKPKENPKYVDNSIKIYDTPNNERLLGISNKIGQCIINCKGIDFNTSNLQEVFEKNVESSNPFEIKRNTGEYDANLNPFNVKFNS